MPGPAPDRRDTVAAARVAPTDPLSASEWWRSDVDILSLDPPGPGVPVTLVDTGVEFGHQ